MKNFTPTIADPPLTPSATLSMRITTLCVNLFTIDQASITVRNHHFEKASPAKNSGSLSSGVDHDNREQDYVSISKWQHDVTQEAKVCDARSCLDYGYPTVKCSQDSQSADRDPDDCSTGSTFEKDEEDNFTFSTSAADSAEFFQFTRASFSWLPASQAWDTISVMSSAEELFEDGKIRPLIPKLIGGSSDEPVSANSMVDADRHTVSTKEASTGTVLHSDGMGIHDLGGNGRRIDKKLNAASTSPKRTTLQDWLEQEEKIALLKGKEKIGSNTVYAGDAQSCHNSHNTALKGQSLSSTRLNSLQQLSNPQSVNIPSMKQKVRPAPRVMHNAYHNITAESRKTKTFLPYRLRLLECLGHDCRQ